MPNFLIDYLAEALFDIARERSTGLLRISTENGLRMAFFEDGDLVYFASEDAREPLAAFLTATGRLDGQDDRARVAALAAPNRPLVKQVLDDGLCDAERLRPWLVTYARECFARAFLDRQGAAKVMPGLRAQHPLPFRVPAMTIVLESVRALRDDELVRESLGPLTWLVEPAPDHFDRLMSLPLNYEEGTIGSQLTARMALKDLVAVSNLPEEAALRSILALRMSGVLPPFEEPKELTDTGRLRMRRAALESGVAVDAKAAAVALGIMGAPAEDVAGAPPLSMNEFEPPAPTARRPAPHAARPVPLPRPLADPAPPPAAQPAEARPAQGNRASGQLRVLASVYVQMAEAEAASGNFNGAMRYYETALEQKPGDPSIVLPFVKYLLSLDKPQTRDAAERLLKQSCMMNPTAVAPRAELVKLYRATGRTAQAIEALAEAERIAPSDPEVRALLDGKARGGLFGRLRGRN